MNTNTTPASQTSKIHYVWIHYITLGIAALALLVMWRELDSTKQALANVQAENKTLQTTLTSVQAELNDIKTGDSSAATRERLAAARAASTTSSALEEIPETLVLQKPTVTQTDDGISVHISFESTESEPPDSIALVVRVPIDTDSRIMALEPIDESFYSDLNTHIDERGKFAVIQGTPANLNALQFNLTVSHPTEVVIQGTSGIKGLELQISQDHVQYRNL